MHLALFGEYLFDFSDTLTHAGGKTYAEIIRSPHLLHLLKQLLDDKGIPYEYVDITESTKNLRAFLAMRDTLPVYDEAKAEGRIGIPSFVWEDGSVTLDTDWLSAGGACTDC